MTWPTVVVPAGSGPMFQRIARAVIDDIRRGRLVANQQLPSSRVLADQLAVHRNTVLAALADLVAQGWIVTHPARGTYVASELPEVRSPARAPRGGDALGFALPPSPRLAGPINPRALRGELALSTGVPDGRAFPVDALARAWRRVVRRERHRLLSYDQPEGHPVLRDALAAMLRSVRSVAVAGSNVLVTRGSQMALDLIARGILVRGDCVVVEALGYPPAWDALRLAGAELVAVPVDRDGLDVGALARVIARRPVRAVYVTSHHQYPTTVTLSAARRIALLDLARRHRFAIIEDDYDHEFHYEGHPVAPLAATDDYGSVIYVGTLSKILAPGLRMGFLAAPHPVVARLAGLRAAMDRQGDRPMEAAVAEFIEEGELERHVRKMRTLYLARRDAMVRSVRDRLGDAFDVSVPRGGISLWARAAPDVDLDRTIAAAAARGVHVASGRRYTFDGSEPHALRLVYAPLTPSEIDRAIATVAAALVRRPRAANPRRR